MRRRFFVEKFDGERAALDAEAAHHLSRVLRAAPGQLYELSDGKTVRLGRVESVGRDGIEFSLGEILPAQKSRLEISLILSVVKFDRFEWALEKATELGVAHVIPFAAARSEKALVAAAAKRSERWRKILLESAQQARRLSPPVLRSVARGAECFAKAADGVAQVPDPRIILSERADVAPLRDVLGKFPRPTARAAVLAIGPEGGWTDEEFAAAASGGFEEASLGNNILRTETAVAATIASVNFALGD